MQSTKIYLYLIIFYIYPGFFHVKKIMRSMKLFHSMIFGSEVWSFMY